jgi:hypothetical protein
MERQPKDESGAESNAPKRKNTEKKERKAMSVQRSDNVPPSTSSSYSAPPPT